MTHLSRYALFEDLSEAELIDLAGAAIHRAVPDGEVLFRQGDPTPGLHLVEPGAGGQAAHRRRPAGRGDLPALT